MRGRHGDNACQAPKCMTPNCIGEVPVAHPERERALPAKDPLLRRHHARHFRAARLHRPAGGFGAQAASQPHPLSWDICPEQPVPGAGDAGQAGQGRSALHDGGARGPDPGRTPGRNDLGATPETMGIWQRRGDLRILWPASCLIPCLAATEFTPIPPGRRLARGFSDLSLWQLPANSHQSNLPNI